MQRHLRLRRRQDFARLRRSGQTQHHRLMRISTIPNGLAHNRYGFITSRHLGTAVTRNRVRRLLREAVRYAHPYIRAGYDVAFVARRPIVGQPYQIVNQTVVTCLKNANLWTGDASE